MADQRHEHTTVIRARDMASKIFRLVGKNAKTNFSKVSRAAVSAGKSMGNLSSRIGPLTSAMAGLGAVASVAGLAKLTNAYASQTDTLVKLSRQLDTTANDYRSLQYAASINGVSAETFEKSMTKMSRAVGDAKLGVGSLTTILKKSNPSLLEQIKGTTNAADAFDLVVEALRNTEDKTERAALAAAAWGRSGQEMALIAEGSAEDIAKLREEFLLLRGGMSEAAGKDAEDFMDSQSRAMQAMLGLRDAIGGKLLPVLTPLLEQFAKWTAANREMISQSVAEAVQSIAKAIQKVDFEKLISQVQGFLAAGAKVVGFLGGAGNAFIVFLAILNGPLLVALASAGVSILKFGATLIGVFAKVAVALAANPIGLIVMGIALAIAAAVFVITKNWDKITGYFNNLFGGVRAAFKDGFLNGIGALLKALDPVALLGDALNGLIDWITALPFVDAFLDKFPALRAGINMISDWFGALSSPISAIADAVSWLGGQFQRALGGINFGALLKDFEPLQVAIRAVAKVFDGLKATFGTGLKAIGALLRGDFSGAWDAAKETVGSLISVFKAAFDGLKNVVGSAVDWIVSKVPALGPIFDAMGGVVKAVAGVIVSLLKGDISGALSHLSDTFKSYRQYLVALFEEMGEAFERVFGWFAKKVPGLGFVFKALGTVLGAVFKGIGALLRGDFLGSLKQLARIGGAIVRYIADVFAGMAKIVMGALDKLAGAFPLISGPIRLVQTVITSTWDAIKGVLGVGLKLGGLAWGALKGALTAARNFAQSVKDGIDKVLGFVTKLGGLAWGTLKGALTAARNFAQSVKDGIDKVLGFVTKLGGLAWGALKGALTSARNFARSVKDGIDKVLGFVTKLGGLAWGALKGALTAARNFARSVKDGIDKVLGFGSKLGGLAWGVLKGALTTARNFAKSAKDGIDKVLGFGSKLGGLAWDMLKGGFEKARNFALTTRDAMAEKVSQGLKFGAVIWDGLKDSLGKVLNFAGNVIGKIRGLFKNPFKVGAEESLPKVAQQASATVAAAGLPKVADVVNSSTIAVSTSPRMKEMADQSSQIGPNNPNSMAITYEEFFSTAKAMQAEGLSGALGRQTVEGNSAPSAETARNAALTAQQPRSEGVVAEVVSSVEGVLVRFGEGIEQALVKAMGLQNPQDSEAASEALALELKTIGAGIAAEVKQALSDGLTEGLSLGGKAAAEKIEGATPHAKLSVTTAPGVIASATAVSPNMTISRTKLTGEAGRAGG